MSQKKGAGIIPFTQKDNTVYFLFHKTFKGRRAGLLVDFGGGSNEGENFQQTAIREFIEETEGLFFAENIENVDQDISSQSKILEKLLQKTQRQHSDWWCSRRRLKDQKRKDWKTYFVEVDYKDVTYMNNAWSNDIDHRFVKRRELLWINGDKLVDTLEHKPEKLWKRVKELESLKFKLINILTGR